MAVFDSCQIECDMQTNGLEIGTYVAIRIDVRYAMTNRAEQNWPEEMTYGIATECGAEYVPVSATGNDCVLGGDLDCRAVEYAQDVRETGSVFNPLYEVK
jgi:hypothetical protein